MRTGIKSHGHNLRFDCDQCKKEEKIKKKRLAREKDLEESESDDDEDDDETEDDLDEDDDQTNGAEDTKRKRTGENSSHCHCPLFKVTDEMKNFMRGGQPFRRCREAEKKLRESNKIQKSIREEIRKNDQAKENTDLKNEVIKLKAKLRQEAREKASMPKVKSFFKFSVINFQLILRIFVSCSD